MCTVGAAGRSRAGATAARRAPASRPRPGLPARRARRARRAARPGAAAPAGAQRRGQRERGEPLQRRGHRRRPGRGRRQRRCGHLPLDRQDGCRSFDDHGGRHGRALGHRLVDTRPAGSGAAAAGALRRCGLSGRRSVTVRSGGRGAGDSGGAGTGGGAGGVSSASGRAVTRTGGARHRRRARPRRTAPAVLAPTRAAAAPAPHDHAGPRRRAMSRCQVPRRLANRHRQFGRGPAGDQVRVPAPPRATAGRGSRPGSTVAPTRSG